MFDTLIGVAVLVVTVLIGLPSAFLLARRWHDADWSELVAAGAGIGVLVQILTGLVLGHSAHYRTTVLVLVLAGFATATGWFAFRDRARLRFPRLDVVSAVLVGLAVASIVFSGPTSYFVFQTGDMGGYVNAANILAAGSGLGGGFPHGFTTWLGNTNLLVGQAAMVDAAMGALGALVVLVTAVLTRRIARSGVAALVVAALAIAHPTARWFSSIPVSESLFAVMLGGSLLLLWRARHSGDAATAAVAGAAMSSLLLIRANALVLSGVVVVAAVVSALLDRRENRRVQLAFGVSATIGLVLAYTYNVEFIPSYFIRLQLEVELPPAVFDALQDLDLLAIGAPLVLAGVVAVVAVFAISRLGSRRAEPEGGAPSWSTSVVVVAIVVVTMAAVVVLGTESLVDAMVRWQPLLLVLAGVGLVVAAAGRAWTDPVMTIVLLSSGAVGLILYAARLDEPLSHAYYLYWDRYIFSDAFVVALVLAGVTASAAARAVRATATRRGRLAGGVVAFVVLLPVAAASAPMIDESVRIERHELFGDSYGALAAIADVVPDDRSEPIVYSGPPAPPEGWFFANLFRAYALPLRQTFGLPIMNVPVEPFVADPQASVGYARALIAGRGSERGFLLRARWAGDHSSLVGAGATLVRTVRHPVWLLSRSLDVDDERYRRIDIVLELYRVETIDPPVRRRAGSGS